MDLIYYLAAESGGRDNRLVLHRALVPKEVTCTVTTLENWTVIFQINFHREKVKVKQPSSIAAKIYVQ